MNRYKAILKYPGSKMGLMNDYPGMFPVHRHYVSVFGGSGTDILGKRHSWMETYNDLDGDLVNLFRILKNRVQLDELCARVADTMNAEEEFLNARDIIRSIELNPVTRAWAFLTLSWQGRVGRSPALLDRSQYIVKLKRDSSIGYQRYLVNHLRDARQRFLNVRIYRRTWQRILNSKLNHRDTLFFLDPPYLGVSPLYRYAMAEADHRELLDCLLESPAKVFLCGYDSPLYRKKLVAWPMRVFPTTSKISDNKSPREECVWMNYDRKN